MLLTDKELILASGSPRRIDMLRAAGAEPVVMKPSCGEEIYTSLTPKQTVMALALRKALSVDALLPPGRDCLLLAADTIVVFGGRIIGKPKDEEDAFRILSELNGRRHQVISGVCILQKIPRKTLVFSDVSDVYFKRYPEQAIRDYIATGEPFDKAGGYAIQGGFGCQVERWEGDLDNIIGLPLERIVSQLAMWP